VLRFLRFAPSRWRSRTCCEQAASTWQSVQTWCTAGARVDCRADFPQTKPRRAVAASFFSPVRIVHARSADVGAGGAGGACGAGSRARSPRRGYSRGFRSKLDLPRCHPWLGRAPDRAGRELPQVSQFCDNPRPPAYAGKFTPRSSGGRRGVPRGRSVRPPDRTKKSDLSNGLE
jgi:hypothetical protein